MKTKKFIFHEVSNLEPLIKNGDNTGIRCLTINEDNFIDISVYYIVSKSWYNEGDENYCGGFGHGKLTNIKQYCII